jgi:hypothetical protein
MNIIDVKRSDIRCMCSTDFAMNSIEMYLFSSVKTLNERIYLQIEISFFLDHIFHQSITLSM